MQFAQICTHALQGGDNRAEMSRKYKDLLMGWHPDKNRPNAKEASQRIVARWDLLESFYEDPTWSVWDEEDNIVKHGAWRQRKLKEAEKRVAEEDRFREKQKAEQERRTKLDDDAADALHEAMTEVNELTSELVARALIPTRRHQVQTKSTACS